MRKENGARSRLSPALVRCGAGASPASRRSKSTDKSEDEIYLQRLDNMLEFLETMSTLFELALQISGEGMAKLTKTLHRLTRK